MSTSARAVWFVATISALAAAGCGSPIAAAGSASANQYQMLSSGWVGCHARDIGITEYETTFAAMTWVATCGSHTFVCGAAGESVHCAELRGDQASRALATPSSRP